MGFSYVAAVAILLSSSLIFFGMVYGSFVQSNTEIGGAQGQATQQSYDFINSQVNITGYYAVGSGSLYNVTLNLTNTGSVTLNLNQTNVLVNGTLISFNGSSEYLFPLQNGNITFNSSPGIKSVKIVFDTGYTKYVEVNV